MSVLKTIKGAFDNVQHDISESFKSITTKSTKAKKPKALIKVDGVDLDAGADLLNKFQEQWEHIHCSSEENARKAQEVDIYVSGLFVRCGHQNESLNHLLTLTAGLPQLLNEINQLSRKLELLENEFEQVNTGLCELENIGEELEVAENKKHHNQQLQMYKERKNQELEHTKVLLAEEHARKARGYEAKLQEKIQERQQVFEEAFKEEIENYKRHGKTQMMPQLTDTVAEDLADITIEEDRDKGVLDDFLKSSEPDESSPTKPVENQEETSDEDGEEAHTPVLLPDEDIDDELGPGASANSDISAEKETPDIGNTSSREISEESSSQQNDS